MIAGTDKDKRRKLTEEQRKSIPLMYENGITIYRIAKTFGVTRRAIQGILFPERYRKNKQDNNN